MADERFSAFARDPRFRIPSRKESRTAIDPRFKRLFHDQDFQKKASIDRYGRKIKSKSGKKELERFYRLEPKAKVRKHERELESSSGAEDDTEDEEAEVENSFRKKRDPAREGGFSESESSEESSSDEEGESESADEAELAEGTAGQEHTEEIPMGEVSRRIAAVNLDWDNIRATDIMAVARSFIPANGRIDKVTIYPSEFGRERLEKEELEGPPREIFNSSKRKDNDYKSDEEKDFDGEDEDEDEDDRIRKQLIQQQASNGDEFDTTKLRQYQLERLRYYYSVIECDSKATAKALYDSMDGREYLSTANFFDLRFIPDEITFEDDRPREECTILPEGYKPNDFRTEALTHSKVRLTWDDDDTTRKEVQKRAFSRAEMDENDLQAYIGSDSSDAESITSRKSAAESRKEQKREAERQKMRAALGLVSTEEKYKRMRDKPMGDMQITFTSGLSGDKRSNGVFENEPQDEESTRDRYIRKERERKQKRKEKMKAARTGNVEATERVGTLANAVTGAEDAGFDDPFFADPSVALVAEKKAKKIERQKKKEAQAARDEEDAARRKELELLMAEDEAENVRHFDMREIEKAEKEAKRRGKTSKTMRQAHSAEAVDNDGFKIDVADPRFSKVMESHEYAIDPTNPRYKGTEAMKALLEEGRKKRKWIADAEDAVVGNGEESKTKRMTADRHGDKDELKGLVARLKGKRKLL
ncbi:hypothetical protein M433DRAFT_154189 [Acidomyces richmondensis BFW]|nr:MAG: hypothetical protein FE78DRAFT_85493 [Acidomyces sp. 'richmondensis']KYG45748.1 hypothetical protein M433DRAFT_154189 [Acidomyces richmondensis BFW]